MKKKHFPEKKIMSLSMIAICAFLMVVGTVAWYTMDEPVMLRQMGLETDDIGVLYVDVKILPYPVDLDQENIRYSDMLSNEELKNSSYASPAPDGSRYNITRMSLSLANSMGDVKIDMGQQRLYSIEEDKLGPGAYGQVIFYIKSVNEINNAYRLKVQPELTYTEQPDMTDSLKAELKELVYDHIRFYGQRRQTGVNQFDYSDRIAYEEGDDGIPGIEGTLVPGQEQEVAAYWCWPYEYQYIPRDSSPVSTTSYDMESYDLGDTKIGNYVPQIDFTFTVTGDLYE